MKIINIVIIGVIVAVLGAVIAYFTRHKKAGGFVIALGVASAGLAGYQSVKDQRLTDLVTSEYEAVRFYQAMYEATGNERYKEIANDEAMHLRILGGYGYQVTGNATQYDLSMQGAIQSERDAVKAYEEALSLVIADATLESDLNRILQDEKEHLNELIEMSISGEDQSMISGIFQDLRDRLTISNVLERISSVVTGILGVIR